MAAGKSLPLHHYSADCILWSFGLIRLILSYFENRILLKPMIGGVASIAHFNTDHEKTQLNRVSLVSSLPPKDVTIHNLIKLNSYTPRLWS